MSSGGIISRSCAGNIDGEAVMAAVSVYRKEGGSKDDRFYRRETDL